MTQGILSSAFRDHRQQQIIYQVQTVRCRRCNIHDIRKISNTQIGILAEFPCGSFIKSLSDTKYKRFAKIISHTLAQCMHLRLHSMMQIQLPTISKHHEVTNFSAETVELSLLLPEHNHMQRFLRQDHPSRKISNKSTSRNLTSGHPSYHIIVNIQKNQ